MLRDEVDLATVLTNEELASRYLLLYHVEAQGILFDGL